jgi:hypothetical protein
MNAVDILNQCAAAGLTVKKVPNLNIKYSIEITNNFLSQVYISKYPEEDGSEKISISYYAALNLDEAKAVVLVAEFFDLIYKELSK